MHSKDETVALIATPTTGRRVQDALMPHALTMELMTPVEIVYADSAELRAASRELDRFDALVVGSEHAIAALDRLPGPVFSGQAFAVGPRTQAALGRSPRIAGPIQTATLRRSEGLMDELRSALPDLQRSSLVFPRAEEGRGWLVEKLKAAGARLASPVAYHTRTVPIPDGAFRLRRATVVGIASGGMLKHLLEVVPSALEILRERRVVAMGPITAEQLEVQGIRADAVADPPSAGNMAEALFRVAREGTAP
ncbi:MAG: uroporphyrinogen-III synthase [Myxococcota bacterium]